MNKDKKRIFTDRAKGPSLLRHVRSLPIPKHQRADRRKPVFIITNRNFASDNSDMPF